MNTALYKGKYKQGGNTMNKHDRMYEQIRIHGENLNRIFGLNEDPIKLAKKLHSLEVKAHKLATDYCNGENNVTTENWEDLTDAILVKLDKIINYTDKGYPIFVNGDARGYALKIDSECVKDEQLDIYKDWGGYGILAPEFDGRN
jgi:hypothetical protein